jgi:ubiquinone/menaquinone biosynthesis C-methylase UbiE
MLRRTRHVILDSAAVVAEESREPVDVWSERLLRTSGYERSGFADGFDANRPSPPAALFDILCLEAQAQRPRLVVDLGSGTGLSTRPWAGRADEVVGVEASPEMRERAEEATSAENVRFVQAYAQATGLPDGAADIVTCSQALHWMEPQATLAEVARILRPGGVFAAYDYDWPPVVHWEVEAAFAEMLQRAWVERSTDRDRMRYSKDGHLDRIEQSGHFRYAREIVLQSCERGSAERIVGMALSLGPMTVMLQSGTTEEEIGLDILRETARRALGDREVDIYLGYRVRLGIR